MSTWLSFRLIVDRILGAILAVLTAPLVGVLAVLVRRHDGDSPLITVPRVGVNGQTFGMWKIRSMRVDTADGHASGLALTSTNDQRITPIGARMRSLHLDELPQLYNVALGQMCLLGPRPEAPQFVDLENPDWRQGYGFQFWRCQHNAFRGDGRDGQICLVLPDHDAVVAITAQTGNMQGQLDLVWEKLLPALQAKALPADAAANEQLKRTLANLVAHPAPKAK